MLPGDDDAYALQDPEPPERPVEPVWVEKTGPKKTKARSGKNAFKDKLEFLQFSYGVTLHAHKKELAELCSQSLASGEKIDLLEKLQTVDYDSQLITTSSITEDQQRILASQPVDKLLLKMREEVIQLKKTGRLLGERER
jgi:hypothetical protein